MSNDKTWVQNREIILAQLFLFEFIDTCNILISLYRWRGENVSTIEVESVLSNVLQQQDTIVYGVQVPGVEGRAGMAAIVQPEGGIDLSWFLSAIRNQLPSYAMPIFLRMVKELDITGKIKLPYSLRPTKNWKISE